MKTRTGVAEHVKGNDQGMTKTNEEKTNILCDYFTEVFTEQDIANIPDAQLHEDLPPQQDMDKAHKNCTIGNMFCLHHITGTAFIVRLKLYVYIMEDYETFLKIYSFIQFKWVNIVSLTSMVERIGKMWSI